jgi:DNA-binding MarR family transcriptional regulator
MRVIRLSGREASVVRAIGFSDAALGSDIQDVTRMELEDVTDVVNSLIAAGFVESIPYTEEVHRAALPATSFELNPAYAHQLKNAIRMR